MKIPAALLLSLSLISCNQQKAAQPATKPKSGGADASKPVAQVPNPGATQPAAPGESNMPAGPKAEPKAEIVNLLGNWQTDCQPVDLGPQTAISPVKSTKAALKIESATKASLVITLYTDNKCATVLTESKANSLLKTYEFVSGKKVDPVLVAKLTDVIKGIPTILAYKATPVAAGAVGEVDATVEGKTLFSSYKVVSDKLHIAAVCLSPDVIPNVNQNCTPKGESASNRGDDFSKATIFNQLK